MPRKPRIEIDGYYYITNRGAEQRVVFKDSEDYEHFLELMCSYSKSYNITIHNYCLMSNNYHLLLEITGETLSKYMRQLNMNYSMYFNKKYKRSGRLWQGRFKSWYVTNEVYLHTLMCYIEQNPLKANIVPALEEYPYSSYRYFVSTDTPECLRDAWIVQNFQGDTEAIRAFFHITPDSSQLLEMKKASSLVEAPNIDKKPNEEKLKHILQKAKDTKHRNTLIAQCYKRGYSQHMIARVLSISQQAVCGVIKREGKK